MRTLVIEDNPDLLRTTCKTLREAGYAVDSSDNGAEGLCKAKSWSYDAVLLDVMLPQLDGWEVLRRLRETNKTPVMMLTARSALRDRVRGLNSGADDYLVKPFEFDELLARLGALIRRSTGQPLPQIKINAVQIDTAARKVWHDGRLVSLTAREYSLLEYLAFHRGKVVTRTMLYDHLLGEDDNSMSNLMDVYVGNVRRKIQPDLIVTRRGHGYCIE